MKRKTSPAFGEGVHNCGRCCSGLAQGNLSKPGERLMDDQAEDQPVMNHVQRLVSEEQRLYPGRALTQADRKRLENIRVELDQCWDLLRQRRALRDVGEDPNEAEVRPPDVVEKYEQ